MNKQRRLETWEAIETFNKIRGAWTMEFESEDEGWWAYYGDESHSVRSQQKLRRHEPN
jgi:hypothetical protein